MCCDQGMPASTLSPAAAARSSSQSGGTVKTRSVLAPISAISRKSRITVSRSGNWAPCEPGPNGP